MCKSNIKVILSSLLLLVTFYSQAQDKQYQVTCVGFYNLENLFDTINQPNVRDGEYTPQGKNRWTWKEYQHKLKNLAKVISGIGTSASPDGCALLGVCEVENRGVLEDLVKEPQIAKRNYKIVHSDSPDERGIDVGLLYQEKYFKVKHQKSHSVVFKDDPDNKTRDQLVVTGDLLGEEVSIIVSHWPSRGGGQQASEVRRIAAAEVGRKIIDSLLAINPNAKIMLMGDLNDDPVNVSIKKYINARGKQSKVESNMLFNPMFNLYKKGIGTLAWGDAWNLFDQILLSHAFLGTDYSSLKYYKVGIYNQPFMIQSEGRYKGYPFRTRAGGSYLGGYSDHFPVYTVLVKES